MKTSYIFRAIFLGSCLTHLALAQSPKKHEILLEMAPAQVQSAVKEHSAAGKIDEVERLTVDGRTIFIVEVDLPGDRDLDLYLTENGELVKRVKEIPLQEAPEAVRQAVDAIIRLGGKLDEIEKITAGGITTFEAEIDRKGPDLKLVIGEDGSILSETESS